MDVVVPDEHLAPAVLPRAVDTTVIGRDHGFRCILAREASAYPGGTRVEDNRRDFIYGLLTDDA